MEMVVAHYSGLSGSVEEEWRPLRPEPEVSSPGAITKAVSGQWSVRANANLSPLTLQN